MNPDPSKLRHQHQTEQTAELHLQEGQQSGREFQSVEEMIRFDAQQHAPPPALSERIKEAIAQQPPPPRPWWKRLFGAS